MSTADFPGAQPDPAAQGAQPDPTAQGAQPEPPAGGTQPYTGAQPTAQPTEPFTAPFTPAHEIPAPEIPVPTEPFTASFTPTPEAQTHEAPTPAAPQPAARTSLRTRTSPIVWGALILVFCAYVAVRTMGVAVDPTAWLITTITGLGALLLIVGIAVLVRGQRERR